jgi:hypothetical protein
MNDILLAEGLLDFAVPEVLVEVDLPNDLYKTLNQRAENEGMTLTELARRELSSRFGVEGPFTLTIH